jgi:hypothetical protein
MCTYPEEPVHFLITEGEETSFYAPRNLASMGYNLIWLPTDPMDAMPRRFRLLVMESNVWFYLWPFILSEWAPR